MGWSSLISLPAYTTLASGTEGGQTGTLKGKEGKQEVLPSFSILSPLINHSLDFYSISPVHPHSSLKLF